MNRRERDHLDFIKRYIGNSSYFVSEGPGRGHYLLSNDVMYRHYEITEVDSNINMFNDKGIFSIYVMGL